MPNRKSSDSNRSAKPGSRQASTSIAADAPSDSRSGSTGDGTVLAQATPATDASAGAAASSPESLSAGPPVIGPSRPPGLNPVKCDPVSGRYVYKPVGTELLTFTVRVDVDAPYPQRRISITVSRLDSRNAAHVVAEVTADQCLAYNHRRITAVVVYRNGNPDLMPGDQVTFEASREKATTYQNYALTLSVAGAAIRRYPLTFDSRYFDAVEFEVDRVENAGEPVLKYDTASHSNRPADLPQEVLSLTAVYQRAGFAATLSPNGTVIPLSAAGVNGTWSTAELHDAMVTYWSRYADRPQWAMWMLWAARHDLGRNVGGLMFDDIGPNQRRGAALFSESFLFDPPADDKQGAAWRQRMMFTILAHEIGHTFNMAHSFQKALGVGQGAPGDPWIPLENEPEARSFMNYPSLVAGGQAAFFSDFRFRFSDEELVFMRHAPRRFVQMGNSKWFVDHGFVAPELLEDHSDWQLEIRPNRERNDYQFLEPVVIEFKLANASTLEAAVDADTLTDGHHMTLFIQREGGSTAQWRPMVQRCDKVESVTLKPGEAIYAAHLVSASSVGWLIDQPGFYRIQAAAEVGPREVVSNVLRIYVAPSRSDEEDRLALDYFTEDVGRALVFGATPALSQAATTLQELVARCPSRAAAVHAAVALASPKLRNQKRLEAGPGPHDLVIRCEKAAPEAAAAQMAALTNAPDRAADTLGHIRYFDMLDSLASALADAGDEKTARQVMKRSVTTMKARDVLESVIRTAQRKLDRMK